MGRCRGRPISRGLIRPRLSVTSRGVVEPARACVGGGGRRSEKRQSKELRARECMGGEVGLAVSYRSGCGLLAGEGLPECPDCLDGGGSVEERDEEIEV